VLGAVLVLSACGNATTEQIYALSAQSTIVDNMQDDTAHDELSSVIPALHELIFVHDGDIVRGSGDEMQWYYTIFGASVINISGFFIDFVGDEAFQNWTQQFIGHGENAQRNAREANILSFIEDFELTIQDLIGALEAGLDMPIYEIDALVHWGRYGEHTDEDLGNASFWARFYSLSDIEALFSNDVYALWTAFPGTGVVHNGRAYSPEWILNNMHSAVMQESIPLYEIERIIVHAGYFPQLDEVREMAESTLQAVR